MSHLKEPIQISFTIGGTLPASTEIIRYPVVDNITFPLNLSSSAASIDSYPTSQISCSIYNGVTLKGNIVIPATSGTITFTGAAWTAAPGDVILINTPASTFAAADLGVTLVGDR